MDVISWSIRVIAGGIWRAQWDCHWSISLTSFQASLVEDPAWVALQESSDHGWYLSIDKGYIQTSSGNMWCAWQDCDWPFHLISFFIISEQRPCSWVLWEYGDQGHFDQQGWQMNKASWPPTCTTWLPLIDLFYISLF